MAIQQAIITLVAAIISGILATIITISINAYLADIKRKQDLVDDIFGFKYQLTDGDVFLKCCLLVLIFYWVSRTMLMTYYTDNILY